MNIGNAAGFIIYFKFYFNLSFLYNRTNKTPRKLHLLKIFFPFSLFLHFLLSILNTSIYVVTTRTFISCTSGSTIHFSFISQRASAYIPLFA
jgi:hypothetical protein